MNVICYDCEIVKCVPSNKQPSYPDIQYCEGWRDFKNMGVSMISVYDYATRTPRIFMKDNIIEFFRIVEQADMLVGFNNWNFDNPLLETIGVKIERERSFDLLRAIWSAAGLDPNTYGYHHGGFGLEAVCLANIGLGKLGDGALAAIMYQRGEIGRLVDYGLRDIMLTSRLLELCARQPIINPKSKPDQLFAERLHVQIPFDIPPISLPV